MSPIIDDLRIDAEIPPQSVRPGTSVEVVLRFVNLDTRPRKVFLRRSEASRYGQSMFRIDVPSPHADIVQPDPISSPPPPTAADFHELAPQATLELSQTLRVPAELKPRKYKVLWTYENRVGRLDGEPIPGIWLGTVQIPFVLNVVARRIGAVLRGRSS